MQTSEDQKGFDFHRYRVRKLQMQKRTVPISTAVLKLQNGYFRYKQAKIYLHPLGMQ